MTKNTQALKTLRKNILANSNVRHSLMAEADRLQQLEWWVEEVAQLLDVTQAEAMNWVYGGE